MSDGCPVCGDGCLTRTYDMSLVTHNGITSKIPCLFSVCGACGVEQADAAQLEANKLSMIKFRESVDAA